MSISLTVSWSFEILLLGTPCFIGIEVPAPCLDKTVELALAAGVREPWSESPRAELALLFA